MTVRFLIAAAAVAVGSLAQAQYVPYYGYGYNTTVNPYTGVINQSGATYDPYTGGQAVVTSGYNPYTGSVGQTVSQYNPYTGTTVRNDQAYNPYTGGAYNYNSAYNPYLNSGYGVNPYYGNTSYYPSYYPRGGSVGIGRPAVGASSYVPWNTGAKATLCNGLLRR